MTNFLPPGSVLSDSFLQQAPCAPSGLFGASAIDRPRPYRPRP